MIPLAKPPGRLISGLDPAVVGEAAVVRQRRRLVSILLCGGITQPAGQNPEMVLLRKPAAIGPTEFSWAHVVGLFFQPVRHPQPQGAAWAQHLALEAVFRPRHRLTSVCIHGPLTLPAWAWAGRQKSWECSHEG